MKIVIIDDEINACTILEYLVSKIDGFSVVGMANGVKEGVTLINTKNPDIVLLDIKMNDGTGFDLLDSIMSPKFHLIFTTAYDEFAIKAFKYSATDYLLKPISLNDLTASFRRIKSENKGDYKLLQKTFTNNDFTKIKIPGTSPNKIVVLKDITHLKSDNNYTWFYFNDDTNLLTSKTLKFYEDFLPSDLFFRCHQSYLVNINYILKYNKKERSILMKNKEEITVATRKQTKLLQLLKI